MGIPRKANNPAIAFEDDELEAVIAGLVMLDQHADEDAELADFARAALARIEAALPPPPPGAAPTERKGDSHHGTIRNAIHAETKLWLRYADRREKESARRIRPLDLGFVGAGGMIGAWCESREDFGHFRLDRIVALESIGERYPGRRRVPMARLRVNEMDRYF